MARRIPPRTRANFIRTHISAIVGAILLPAMLIGGWLTYRSAMSERGLHEAELRQGASEISFTVDREILAVKSILMALARSQALLTGDLQVFRRDALDVSRELGMQIILFDKNLERQVASTLVPLGTSPPRVAPPEVHEIARESFRSGKFVVSNAFLGQVTQQHYVGAGLPVFKDGAPVYFLSIGIPARTFTDLLLRAQLGQKQIACVVDRRGVFVARSEDEAAYVGTTDIPGVEEQPGVMKIKTRNGSDFRRFYHRSELTGWVVGIGVPESTLEAPIQRAMLNYVVGSGALFFVAVALSYHLGGYLSQSAGALGIDRQPTREEFQLLFDSAPSGVLLVDENGRINLVNEGILRGFRYDRDELIGKPVEMLVPVRFRPAHSEMREAYARSPTSRPMGAGRDLFGQRKDGSEFPIEIALNPIRTRTGNFVMATVIDISERTLATERLSAAVDENNDLRRRYLRAQEDERLRLAHELHDQSGQSLAAIMLELKLLESCVDDAAQQQIRVLVGQLDVMGKALHHVASELRPAAIDELGLATALANYVSDWSRQFGIQADFYSHGTLDDLPNEIRTTIYRVTQEALTNIARHARGATSASVIVDRMRDVLQLTIEDNGGGFDLPDSGSANGSSKCRGLGVVGMRERMSLIGGELVIEASAEQGTTIFARFPLERPRLTA